MKRHIKKTIHKATTIQPIIYAFGSAALAILLVVGAIGRDVSRLLS